jgi:molybdate transport system ATP-binding protein
MPPTTLPVAALWENCAMPNNADLRTAAVVFEHGDDADSAMAVAVAALRHAGMRVGGLLQVFGPAIGPCRREMNLLVLGSGDWIRLDQPLGPEAQGCTLDGDALTRAGQALRDAVQARPDLLVVSRFGKQEALGGGMRAEIAEALLSGIPVLVAVRAALSEEWESFLGAPSYVLPTCADTIATWARAQAAPLPQPAIG